MRGVRLFSSWGWPQFGALLKHTLVPLEFLQEHIPQGATVLDGGCGEGILSSLLQTVRPDLKVISLDRDENRIRKGWGRMAPSARCLVGELQQIPFKRVDVVILNDVLHHRTFEEQSMILRECNRILAPQGLLILKEVDAMDRKDRVRTTSFDRKIYPKDVLSFRPLSGWLEALRDAGLRSEKVTRQCHPWIASRTLIVARRFSDGNVSVRHKKWSLEKAPGTARVLVTGATGFIGRGWVEHLIQHGLEGKPVELICLVRDNSRIPGRWRQEIQILEGDLAVHGDWMGKLDRIDYVFHLAAEVDYFHGKDHRKNNVTATANLLEAVARSGVRRFVFAGTVGSVERAPDDLCTIPLTEESSPHPSTEYGQTKLDAENLVRASQLPWTIIRIPWCYGPGMSPRNHVRKLLRMIDEGSWITRWPFPGRLSLVSLEDLCSAFETAAVHPKSNREIFTACDDEPVSFRSLFKELSHSSTHPYQSWILPPGSRWVVSLFRRWIPFHYKTLFLDGMWSSNAKLKSLGWAPSANRGETLLKMAESARREERWGTSIPRLLITGAASGIGRACARAFLAQGYRLTLADQVALWPDEFQTHPDVERLTGDLTDNDFLASLCRRIGQESFAGVFLIAGGGQKGFFKDQTEEECLHSVKLNVESFARMSHAALVNFQQNGAGRLILMGSSIAGLPLPGMAAYAAAKSYVMNLALALSQEVQDTPAIQVGCICPSGTATGFQKAAGVKMNPKERLLDPAEVAVHVVEQFHAMQMNPVTWIGMPAILLQEMTALMPWSMKAVFTGYWFRKKR